VKSFESSSSGGPQRADVCEAVHRGVFDKETASLREAVQKQEEKAQKLREETEKQIVGMKEVRQEKAKQRKIRQNRELEELTRKMKREVDDRRRK